MRVLAFVAALTVAAPVAQAQYYAEDADTGWFVAGFGGVGLQRDQVSESFDATLLTPSGEATAFADFDPGISGGVRVGYAFEAFETGAGPVQLRFALDHLYRQNDLSGLTLELGGSPAPITALGGDQSSNAFHGLALIEFRGSGRFVPYLGVGAGVAGIESDAVATIDLGDGPVETQFGGTVDARFSYEILGGIAYRLTPSIDIMIEGRFIDSGDPTFDLLPIDGGPSLTEFESEFEHFNVLAGVQFTF